MSEIAALDNVGLRIDHTIVVVYPYNGHINQTVGTTGFITMIRPMNFK